MKIAIAQTNPTVGDIAANRAQLRQAIEHAGSSGARLTIFPELAIIGYPPKDLLLSPHVIERCAQAVDELAAACTETAAIIGYPFRSEKPRGLALHNAAALCAGGRIVHRHVKSLLPTYDVFDEQRYFEPGDHTCHSYEWAGVRFGLSICEDLWNDPQLLPRQLYHDEPVRMLAEAGAQVLVNCSASPFVINKHTLRLRLAAAAARKYAIPIIYCNQVGGNDDLIFDGNSFVLDARGQIIAHAADFQTDLLLFDLEFDGGGGRISAHSVGPAPPDAPNRANRIETPKHGIESAYHALVLGLRDYCSKCGFQSIVVGLSGGIDSAVTCAICVAAIGAANVRAVSMPSRYSSAGSQDDAAELAQGLAVRFQTIPISQPHEILEELLTQHFAGREPDITEENIQARLRGLILMALSNKFGALLVTTGNKSELAVGYCTLYGDMCGGLAVLSDVPKTMVWRLARWINDSSDSPLRRQYGGPVIPQSSIDKPPSAELRTDQADQDTLPPYDILDQIIERYVERDEPAGQIITETGIDADQVLGVLRLINRNEYKRQQAAPGLKITGRAFGFGRRMPIAQRYDNRVTAAPRKG